MSRAQLRSAAIVHRRCLGDVNLSHEIHGLQREGFYSVVAQLPLQQPKPTSSQLFNETTLHERGGGLASTCRAATVYAPIAEVLMSADPEDRLVLSVVDAWSSSNRITAYSVP